MYCKFWIDLLKKRVGVYLDLLDLIIIMYVIYLYVCYKVFICDFILNFRKEIFKKGFKIRK